MQTTKDNAAAAPETAAEPEAISDNCEAVEGADEATLKWLLELDRDDPEENLFIVDGVKSADFSLSAQEAAVAARPMTRGRANADDLSTYVEEEIVLGDVGITFAAAADEDAVEDEPEEDFGGLMAVEFSREVSAEEEGLLTNVADGSDILGLDDQDDMGDQYLTIRRVKKSPVAESGSQPQEAVAAVPAVEVVPGVEGVDAGEMGDDREASVAADAPEMIEAGLDDVESLESPDIFADAAQESVDYAEEMHGAQAAGELLGAVTPRLAGLMAELEAALATRLSALGWAPGSVAAEVRVAPDEETVAEARADEFEPLAGVCSATPEALADLPSEYLDALYLRLFDTAGGEICNRLFLEDPSSGDQPAAAEPALRLVKNQVFDDDLLDGDLDEPVAATEWMPDGEEIDAIFGELDGGEPDLPVDELPLVDEVANGSEDSADVEPAGVELFNEDILASEPCPEPEVSAAASEEEIDRLFEELDSGDEDGGICGLDVDEFVSGGAVPGPEEAGAATAAPQICPASEPEDMSWCIPAGVKFSQCSPSGGDIFAEFLDAFIEEGSAELEKLEDAISQWETDPASAERQTVVGRVLHTIKGIARGVGLHYYATLIHNFETLLEALPAPSAFGETEYFRVVNAWLDAAVRGMDFVRSERRDIASELPYRGEAPEPAAGVQTEPPEAEQEDTAAAATIGESRRAAPDDEQRRREDKKLADEGARALAAQQSVRITSEKLDLLLNLTNQAQQLGVRTVQGANRTKRVTAELQGRLTSIRAHIADIASGALFSVTARGGGSSAEMDALEMDRYSELQEAANILREGVEDLADLIDMISRNNGQAEALLKQQSTVISSIGSAIRAARVVPVSRLMPGLRRLVRTLSTELDKEVALRVTNEVGTLDRDDYARCQTILEHMVRNALDHGIESARERKGAAKPSVGQITLDVRQSGADSVIVLSDDGRGMDPDRIRESAIRKGLDVDAYALSDEEALKLIFHKGFSTAAALSQVSGRGVGMDIVASELQKMGGDIRIVSEVGKGTAFHLRIPSNVAVNGALLVTAGDSSYAIPLGGLIAVDEVPVDTFFAAVEAGEKLTLSAMQCEPAYLGTLCRSGSLPDRAAWRKTVPVIVAGTEARFMAIAVDDVQEALELVIRSLGAQFAAVPGVAGGATTADGEAVVALDLNVLVSCIGEGQSAAVFIDQPREEKLLALVVDDSRTQRMVATSQLETVGLETATAENGAVAIDWLNTTERLPDVVLMDVEMPVKDGIQALREIRKSARFNHIPVIMITSRTGVKHRTLAEEAGCNGYMGKPFNFRMLIGQINELTGHRLELEQG